MRLSFRDVRRLYKLTGLDLKSALRNLRSMPYYCSTWRELQRQSLRSDEPFQIESIYPVLCERFEQAGVARGHYFHQDLYVAQKVFQHGPQRHIDVGSRIDGFVAHVASFRIVEAIDVRPLKSEVPNLRFLCADLMQELPSDLIEATDSLSCLHAVEHFGLGRYGDPVNFEGHLAGIRNMSRILQPGGRFYLSTPIGKRQRIEFNAHRVFSVPYLLDQVTDQFDVKSFAYVDDSGALNEDADVLSIESRRSFDLSCGCRIFELTKKAA